MYHYVCIGGYLVWRYSYLLEYSYNVLYYGNTLRHVIFDKKNKEIVQDDLDEDWILCEPKIQDTVIVQNF